MVEVHQKNAVLYENDTVPLCVDLDQTLIRTDTLIESVFKLIKSKPWIASLLPFWLLKGRYFLKERLASHVTLSPIQLPYNREVFFHLKRMAKRGRTIILVTGAHESIAKSVCDYLGVFDGYLASSNGINNVGSSKAKLLEEKFGKGGFDYIGDSKLDLKVWALARRGGVVSNQKHIVDAARELTHIDKVFRTKVHPLKSVVKAIRVHQWAKNLLIFVPLILGIHHSFMDQLVACLWGFASFSMMASAIYLINDIFDLEADRQHVDKRNRPFAAGDLPISFAGIAVPVLLCGSAITAYMTGTTGFWFILSVYVIVTSLYTFKLKKLAIVDIIVLTSLYSLRLWAGRVLAEAPLSEWLLAFSGFFFLSLAMVKRMSELLQMRTSGKSEALGRGYHIEDIPIMLGFGSASGYGATVVMSLYINSQEAKIQYENPGILWLICPILIYWFTRIWFLANRGIVHSDPVKFALSDPVSLGIGLGMGIIWYSAKGFAWPL